jgi:hypothetical protein
MVSLRKEDAEVADLENLPASYRNGVIINNTLYVPILTSECPYCLMMIDFGRRKDVHQKLVDKLVIARDQAKKLRHGTH